jgi:hypothetical protein
MDKKNIKILNYWSEIESQIINTWTDPIKSNSKYNFNEIEKIRYFKKINKDKLIKTLKYIFFKLKEIIYVRIRNNKLYFWYLNNADFNNDWYHFIDFHKYKNAKKLKEKRNKILNVKTPHILPPNKWSASGCLLTIEDFSKYNKERPAYVSFFYKILYQTCDKFKVPDVDLLINRKDFPLIRKDFKPSYTDLYPKNFKLNNNDWYPVCSQNTTNDHLDIPIPTYDDYKSIINPDQQFELNWDNKKNKLVFRGSATGCNVDFKNLRIKLVKESKKYNKMDLGITGFPKKIKVNNKKVDFMKPVIKKSNFIDKKEQSKYKYILDIDGNSAAYRFGPNFKMKSCQFKIKSKSYLWFNYLLRDKIDYYLVNNLNEINKLMEYDNTNKKIAQNGYDFYQRYINLDYMTKYWFKIIYLINQLN